MNATTVKLNDVCERITVGHVGPMADKYEDKGVPFLRSQNITPFRLSLEDVKYIPESFHASLRKSVLRPGDVAVVRTGYPGTACVIPSTLPEANCADLVVITPSHRLNPYYLAALFNSAYGRASVAGNLVGVAQQHFNVGAAKEMRVPLPSRKEQDRVAGILSAYDELIENCRRRIKILEDMARSLYREWFVQFRYPGYESVPLMPSLLGAIPQGWGVRCLKEVATVTYGYAFKSSRFNTDGIGSPIVRIRDIPCGNSTTYTDEEAPAKYRIRNGHILVGMDGDFHMGIWSGGDALQVQRVARFEPMLDVSNYHLFLAIGEPIRELNRSIVGTTVAHLGDAHISKILFLLPTASIREKARRHFDSLECEITNLRERINNLRSTRDLLLPHLMSARGASEASVLHSRS